MILFFSKKFRQEEKLINRVTGKIRRSKSIKQEYGKNETNGCDLEVYKLDDIDVCFNLGRTDKNAITIKDKNGDVIYTMDCHYDQYDQMQRIRADWFSSLLKTARNIYDKRTKEAKDFKEGAEKVKIKEAEQQREQTAERQRDAAMKEALNKLR